MPKTSKKGDAKKSELPGPVARSDKKARDTYAKTYDSALEHYEDEGRAARTAFAALKHTHEKVGDRWQKKAGGRKGPSDASAKKGGLNSRPTAGGVDAEATKEHLLGVAKKLDVKGRSKMRKKELVAAIQKANEKKTAKARK